MAPGRPLIGIPADRRMVGNHAFHMVGEKYARAVMDAAGAVPLLIPSLAEELGFDELLERLDGLVFTGSPSNVEPHRYQGPAERARHAARSGARCDDAAADPQGGRCGVPVLGICRGFQEMNVAFGGTLHQRLHEVPGHLDHRDDETQPLEVQYGPAHEVTLEPGGVLRAAGRRRSHPGELAALPGHRAARAGAGRGGARTGWPDRGLPRADARRFALAVQWHPEWQAMSNPFSRALFAAFGAGQPRARAEQMKGVTYGE